jgi:hypothetical protein
MMLKQAAQHVIQLAWCAGIGAIGLSQPGVIGHDGIGSIDK